MPWHVPEDLKRFKAVTMGNAIVMGRKTFESIGRLLPGRTTIIVTRQRDYKVAGAIVVASLQDAIDQANSQEVFIVGGGELYREAMPLADRVYLTRIALDPCGDTFFAPLEVQEWRRVSSETGVSANGVAFEFLVLDRASASVQGS